MGLDVAPHTEPNRGKFAVQLSGTRPETHLDFGRLRHIALFAAPSRDDRIDFELGEVHPRKVDVQRRLEIAILGHRSEIGADSAPEFLIELGELVDGRHLNRLFCHGRRKVGARGLDRSHHSGRRGHREGLVAT